MKLSIQPALLTVAVACLVPAQHVLGFASMNNGPAFTSRGKVATNLASTLSDSSTELKSMENEEISTAVRVPLKFLGPYPCLGLKFPNLATASQRAKNATGISLDFVLDTAANVNTINGQVAKELNLETVGTALPGVSAGGAMEGGDTFLLGDCELEGLPTDEEPFTFMTELSASALPVASPAAAGLLSLAFFYSFEGGVEFNWGAASTNANVDEETRKLPPSVTFHGSEEDCKSLLKNMVRIPLKELPVTRLPSVNIEVNGVTIPALFDTGSPITVLNAQAAEKAGIQTIAPPKKESTKGGLNPFSAITNRFQEAQATAQAAARGEVLSIASATGGRVDLIKSQSPMTVSLVGNNSDDDDAHVDLGPSHIYVGDLPGLAALNGLGADSPPAAVLGLDVLRTCSNVLLRARNNEVYFGTPTAQ